MVFSDQVPNSQPLFRYYKEDKRDHFYSFSGSDTADGGIDRCAYKCEGLAGYCYPDYVEGTIPLFQYYHEKKHDHLYTTDINEIGTTMVGMPGMGGYKSEGVLCYVPSALGTLLMSYSTGMSRN